MTEKTLSLPAAPVPTGGVSAKRQEAPVVKVVKPFIGKTDKEIPWDARNWSHDHRAAVVKHFEDQGHTTGTLWTVGRWRYDLPGIPYMLYAQTDRHPMLVAVTLDDLRRSLGEDRPA